jgi:hypothetical protein
MAWVDTQIDADYKSSTDENDADDYDAEYNTAFREYH